MKIIKNNFFVKPFSCELLTEVIIPGTDISIIFYPHRFIIRNITKDLKLKLVKIFLDEVVINIQVFLNIESQFITVYLQTNKGICKYKIFCEDNKLNILLLKHYLTNLNTSIGDISLKKKKLILDEIYVDKHEFTEKLSTGIFKKQEWLSIQKRASIAEFIPYIYKLGGFFNEKEGNSELLDNLSLAIEKKDFDTIKEILQFICKNCFRNLFIPDINDIYYRGLKEFASSETYFLRRLYEIIKKNIISFDNSNIIKVLNFILPDMHCGKLTSIYFYGGKIDIEWSKKVIKKLIYVPKVNIKLKFVFNNNIKSFRLTEDENKKFYENKSCINFSVNKKYLFDRFLK